MFDHDDDPIVTIGAQSEDWPDVSDDSDEMPVPAVFVGDDQEEAA